MDLVSRFLSERRDKVLMRLGCWLVCFSLIVGLMLPQQRAEALVGELTAVSVASVAAAYLGACGLSFVTQGMDKDALVSSVQRLINEFLSTELGGISIQDWLGNIWDVSVLVGKLLIGRSLTDELMTFAQWVAGKYAAQVGVNQVFVNSESYTTLQDGSKFYFSVVQNDKLVSLGTLISSSNSPVVFSTGYSVTFGYDVPAGSFVLKFSDPDGRGIISGGFPSSTYTFGLFIFDDKLSYFWSSGSDWKFSSVTLPLSSYAFFDFVSSDEALSIDRTENPVYIPDGIADGQGIALDVGLGAVISATETFEGILDKVIAGELDVTMTAADEKVEPVDPPAETIPDVDELGLPALGAALTSRFPFSIPWDFMRAVQLLAAPAKAPYFEVDFMEPLADRVGGWKGSTKIVLDFSEYAIIGQVSRWTSTIGFCMMLAGATKRLIWTA